MSVKDKITEFFWQTAEDPDDSEDVTQEEQPEQKSISKYEKKASKAQPSASAYANISIMEPRSFEDAFSIANKLKAGGSVMVNLRKLDGPYKQRMIDILQGVTYGLDGKTIKTDDNSILCTPRNITVESHMGAETEGDE